MDQNILVKTESLSVDFTSGKIVFRALHCVNAAINKGEFVSIVGVSGSGKTTLLNTIGGLITPASGSVVVDGVRISSLSEEERTRFRREHIGFIFQNDNLIPSLNVFQNICFSAWLAKKEFEIDEVRTLARQLHIEDKLMELPDDLSGGQRQRVAIARAMLAKPALLLADEPTGSLDSANGRKLMQLLRAAVREQGMTVLMVTHNEEFASLTDRILHIEDGRIIAEDSAGRPCRSGV
jgi:putative ABC transport system ATP-binding protein